MDGAVPQWKGKQLLLRRNLSGGMYMVWDQRDLHGPSRGRWETVVVRSQTRLFTTGPHVTASCEAKSCDCSREGRDQRGPWWITVDIQRDELLQPAGSGSSPHSRYRSVQLLVCHQLSYLKSSLLWLAHDLARFSDSIVLNEGFLCFTKGHKTCVSAVEEAKSPPSLTPGLWGWNTSRVGEGVW